MDSVLESGKKIFQNFVWEKKSTNTVEEEVFVVANKVVRTDGDVGKVEVAGGHKLDRGRQPGIQVLEEAPASLFGGE